MRITATIPSHLLLSSLLFLIACGREKANPNADSSELSGNAGVVERFELEGGPKVVLVRVEGLPRVAVQAIYDVGIIDEPRGMAQASHLIEHLACMGATAKTRADEAFQNLNQIGMANAETLPSLTHYDYGLPADRFEVAIQTEAERLRSLAFDRHIIVREAERCYGEVQAVASRTPPALGKFSLMAAAQGWRHGIANARVLGGLAEAPLSALQAFHKRFYSRRNLTLIVIGSQTRDLVLDMVKKHFADLPSTSANLAVPPRIAGRQAVQWDVPTTILYMGFVPPSGKPEQLVLTAAFQELGQRLTADSEVQELASGVDASNMVWPVGRCPAFAAFTMKPGVKWIEAEAKLAKRFRAAIDALSPESLAASLPMLADLPWTLNAAFIKSNAEAMVSQMGSLNRAYDAVLGNSAIQIGLRDVWLGEDRSVILSKAQEILNKRFPEFVKTALSEERAFVTILVPSAG